MSVNAHHKPREVSSALHAEGTDEEVEDCGDEDYDGCYVVQVIQTILQGAVIQVATACDTHTHIHSREREGSNCSRTHRGTCSLSMMHYILIPLK